MRRIADALNRIHAQLPAVRAITCLETTAGTGTTLGSTFEQLAFIRALVHEPARVAFPTAGDFLRYMLSGHLAWHLGQLSIWRAAAAGADGRT